MLLPPFILQSPINNPRAPTNSAPNIPDPVRVALPGKVRAEGPTVGCAPVDNLPVANVDRPTVVGYAGTEAGTPPTRPTSGLPVTPGGRVSVVNFTWGTVTLVEMTDVVKEEGIAWPTEGPVVNDMGIVTVLTSEMVVTGMETGTGGAMLPAVASKLAEEVAVGVGLGHKVMVLGTFVMIPGLAFTAGAQIPAK